MASSLPKLRLVHFSDVYELKNLPKFQTFLARLSPSPSAVILGGDFLSPSALSALDGGKGMVATLRAVGVTHAILGNHEADLPTEILEKRLRKLNKSVSLINSNIGAIPNAPWFSSVLKPFDVVKTPCNRVSVALGGFLSDERGIFRDNTFRGGLIRNVEDSFDEIYLQSVASGHADVVVPVTHQTVRRDAKFAQHVLEHQNGDGIVLGGHEHSYIHETVTTGSQSATIIKGISDVEGVHVVDLMFDTVDDQFQIVETETELIHISDYKSSHVVKQIVDSHMSVLKELENETIVDAEGFIPPGAALSSQMSRYRQTTVGSVLCMAVKEELNADVAIINGATIKGNTKYPSPRISYAQLSEELPFPTKMVTVEMTRRELHEAIFFSRSNPPTLPDGTEPERKGFLQVDIEFDRIGFHTGGQDDNLVVALPRNLLKGFCGIKPLVDLGNRLQKEGRLNLEEDDFLPAIDLVVRHFSKERWYDMVHDYSFDQLDVDGKGFLSRDDISSIVRDAIGHDPPSFVIDDMMMALDCDQNGMIDQGEFSHLLAQMEREHGSIQFH